jgi:hypothetical protein
LGRRVAQREGKKRNQQDMPEQTAARTSLRTFIVFLLIVTGL